MKVACNEDFCKPEDTPLRKGRNEKFIAHSTFKRGAQEAHMLPIWCHNETSGRRVQHFRTLAAIFQA